MRKISALLLALATAIPAPVRAQTRVAVVPSGLSVSAAPAPVMTAPAMTLSAAVLPAASLAPSLIAPKAIAAAPQAVIAAPNAVPAALTAITPAAAKAEKPGSDEARAAGTALFDGAARLSALASGDGPSVPASAPEDRRSSGLSPPTDSELAAAYREARPRSGAVETFGRDFAAAASQLTQKYTFMGDYFLQSIRADPSVMRAAADLVETHDARDHEPSRRFMQLLGRWHAFKDHAQEKLIAVKIAMMKRMGQEGPGRNMPPSPIPGGEYWDMAAGMNAQGFIHRELEPGTNYSFFDYSPFVVSYLKTAAELAGAKNAAVVEGDINKLERPAKPLAVLRTKNAVHYVPGFDKKLEQMVDWIAPGGQLVIQNDPNPGQRAVIVEKHGPLVRRLIAEGWEFEYGFSGSPGNFGVYALDTIVLTRPKLAWEKSAEDAAREWSSYERAVKYLEARFNPMGFLFR